MLEKSSSQSTCSWRKIRCFQMRLQHFISERQVREEYRALRLTEIKDRHLLGSSDRENLHPPLWLTYRFIVAYGIIGVGTLG